MLWNRTVWISEPQSQYWWAIVIAFFFLQVGIVNTALVFGYIDIVRMYRACPWCNAGGRLQRWLPVFWGCNSFIKENNGGQCSRCYSPKTADHFRGGCGLSLFYLFIFPIMPCNVVDVQWLCSPFVNLADHIESQGQPALTMACLCTG